MCSLAFCTTVLIQQNDGSGGFNRSWREYKVGFGDITGNYWLGNEILKRQTANNRYKLRFDLQQRDTGNWYYAEYNTFRVLSEADNYTLQVGGFSGNTGYDVFSRYHNGEQFSTIDRDNDGTSSHSCAAWLGSGFWYNACAVSPVNAAHNTGRFLWLGLPGNYHLKSTRMWMQCKQ